MAQKLNAAMWKQLLQRSERANMSLQGRIREMLVGAWALPAPRAAARPRAVPALRISFEMRCMSVSMSGSAHDRCVGPARRAFALASTGMAASVEFAGRAQ